MLEAVLDHGLLNVGPPYLEEYIGESQTSNFATNAKLKRQAGKQIERHGCREAEKADR